MFQRISSRVHLTYVGKRHEIDKLGMFKEIKSIILVQVCKVGIHNFGMFKVFKWVILVQVCMDKVGGAQC